MVDQESAADKFYNNTMATIKLRTKGSTKLSQLPKGVFRCVLEYQQDKLFCRYEPSWLFKKKQDRQFPIPDRLNYNNYLVAVNEIPDVEFQFCLSKGAVCKAGTKDNWRRVEVQEPQEVRKIEIKFRKPDKCLVGLKFYAKNDALVFQVGPYWAWFDTYMTHTVYLEVGERVIGYRSRSLDRRQAVHYDF